VRFVPFFSAAWMFLDRFGLVLTAGASIALNEKEYQILQLDGGLETVVEPYPVKFSYGAGLIIQL